MKKLCLLLVFFCFATSLFAKKDQHHSSENQKSSHEKVKEKTIEDHWNDWKKDPYSSFNETSSSKQGKVQNSKKGEKDFYQWDFKKNWQDSPDFSFKEQKTSNGKKIGPDSYERTLYKNKNNEVTVQAKKDEKNSVSVSVRHKWNSD